MRKKTRVRKQPLWEISCVNLFQPPFFIPIQVHRRRQQRFVGHTFLWEVRGSLALCFTASRARTAQGNGSVNKLTPSMRKNIYSFQRKSSYSFIFYVKIRR